VPEVSAIVSRHYSPSDRYRIIRIAGRLSKETSFESNRIRTDFLHHHRRLAHIRFGAARARRNPGRSPDSANSDSTAPAAPATPGTQLAKAEALYQTRTVLYLFGMVFGIVVLCILLKLRVAPAFRDLAERTSKHSFLQALIFVPLLTLLIAIISLPIDIYEQHISRAYGLSVQGWASWAGDWCKAEGISLIILVPVVFGLFRVIRKSPQRWWFYFWLLTLPFLVLLIFVTPVILDPLFNTFEPLEKKQPLLVTEIEKVTHHGGLSIPRDRMFEMEASEKVTTYNAYVTGIGATKRVVVWDNTSRDLTIPETLFVFGHEMGHYVLNHVYKGLAFFAVLMLAGFWLGRRIVLSLLARWGEAWHIRGINDLAALPCGWRPDRQRLQPPHRTPGRYLRTRGNARPVPQQPRSCSLILPEARREKL
jgi:Zn-dependent protease with chaperone function